MIQEISDSNINDLLSSGQPVMVDFWAPWCGPCKMMLPIVEELANEYENKVIIGKLNVDENDETCAKFGIMNIPTMLFFKNGEMVDRQVGATRKADLQAKLDALL